MSAMFSSFDLLSHFVFRLSEELPNINVLILPHSVPYGAFDLDISLF